MMKRWMVSLAALALLPGTARAQATDDCFPPKHSNEARAMATFDVPLAFSAVQAPERQPAGRLRLGLELSLVPNIDRATSTPTVCRPGKGPENTDLLFAAPRPRLTYTLPSGIALEASWVPPVRISEIQANLVSLAVSRTTSLNQHGAALMLRLHGTFGVIKAPITCDDTALQDATSECYQGTRSDDAFHPNVIGVEAAVGWKLGTSLRPYLGAGYNHLAPRFQVNFTNQFGSTDRRRVTVDLDRGVLFAGATWSATRTFELSGEIYSAPTDAVTARLAARVKLR